jgi:hypothetical protein
VARRFLTTRCDLGDTLQRESAITLSMRDEFD